MTCAILNARTHNWLAVQVVLKLVYLISLLSFAKTKTFLMAKMANWLKQQLVVVYLICKLFLNSKKFTDYNRNKTIIELKKHFER